MGDEFEVDPAALRTAAGQFAEHAGAVESHGRTLGANTSGEVGRGPIGTVVSDAVKRGIRVVEHGITDAVRKYYDDVRHGLLRAAEETERVDREAGSSFAKLAEGREGGLPGHTVSSPTHEHGSGGRDDDVILFGQARISPEYSDSPRAPATLRGRNIEDVAGDLRDGRLSPDDFRIVAFRHEGQLVTNNNRSLAVLSLAGKRPTNVLILENEAEVRAAIARGDADPDLLERLGEPTPYGDRLPSPRIAVTPSQRDWTVHYGVHVRFGKIPGPS
jgi:hypothetical protein